MARYPWFSGTFAHQKFVVTQARNKIDVYAVTLGWTPAQVTAFKAVCDEIIALMDYYESCRTSIVALTGWRDHVFYGQPRGSFASAAPEFEALPDIEFRVGIIDMFINYREQIVANPNYIPSIGEDMMLVGAEIPPVPPEDITASVKIAPSQETLMVGVDSLVISGSLQGANAAKFFWTPKGGEMREVASVTSLPATITITKTDPNEPESGQLQVQYYKKNLPYGNPSPNYNVTLD